MERSRDRKLVSQAERLYEAYADLARAFQFRDREQISCRGLSVSQCHVLEALSPRGGLTMKELAAALFLDASTVTRLVDRLAGAGLVERSMDPADRRICRVQPTDAGDELLAGIRADLVAEMAEVLRQVPVAAREAVIAALRRLLAAFRARRGGPPPCARRTRRRGDLR